MTKKKNSAYYKYQFYAPHHPKADDLGYVHSTVGYLIRKVLKMRVYNKWYLEVWWWIQEKIGRLSRDSDD